MVFREDNPDIRQHREVFDKYTAKMDKILSECAEDMGMSDKEALEAVRSDVESDRKEYKKLLKLIDAADELETFVEMMKKKAARKTKREEAAKNESKLGGGSRGK